MLYTSSMFIRVNTTPNSPRKSIQIVESIRMGNKVKQKIIRYVGIANDESEEQKLKDLANEIIIKLKIERIERSPQTSFFPMTASDIKSEAVAKRGRLRKKKLEDILPPSQVLLEDIKEEARIIEGVHDIGGAVFDDMYPSLFKGKRVQACLRDVVLARLVYPCSKHQAQKKLLHHFDKQHSLDSIYRMMDVLYPRIGEVKRLTFAKTKTLFPEKIDLLFFDVTTLYFESTEVDELRNFGYSKDHRFNTTQLVLALATNQDGLPIGYELFPGNRAEVTVLVAAIESWKKLFHIDSVCFVGDRAMFSRKNIELLESYRYHYIIAAKLKTLSKIWQEKIMQDADYRPTVLNKELAWIGEFDYQDARLIVSYKTKRALKDQKERQTLLTKIEKALGKSKKGNPAAFITNSGVKKFITQDANATVTLDAAKVAQAAQWDGLHGIITNIRDDSAESLIARYACLWVIEESFRINKHTLAMRPIFHFKPERIHAHIAICYMTFSVLRHLQYRVNLTQKISINSILDELLNVQASIHVHKRTKDKYRVPGYLTHNARKIYKAFQQERSEDATVYLP